jgi:hypothetical protein
MAYSGPAVLEVLAGAGTGKTRSVTWVGDMFADYGVTGIYLALNRSVADEVAGKFTRGNVAGMTVHSLAFRIAGRHPGIAPLLDRVGHRGSVAPWEMAKHFRFRETFTFTAPADVTRAELTGRDVKPSGKVKSNAMMKAALATLRQWCATALDAPDDSCVPRPSGMGDEDFHGTYAPRIIDLAGWLWTTDICSPWGELTFTHDYYLKMVSLTHPDLSEIFGHGSLLIVDEAQDMRPAMLSILRDQLGKMRIVAVGDRFQALYAFTGAVDALPEIASWPGAQVLPLTQSFRFGPAIAGEANRVLDCLDPDHRGIRLRGLDSLDSAVGTYARTDTAHTPEADAVLVRTNAAGVGEAGVEQERGRAVCLQVDRDYVTGVMDAVTAVCAGRTPRLAEMKHLKSREQLKSFARPGGDAPADLGALIRLGLRKGPAHVTGVLNACVPADRADVTVTTIHKAKGGQWGSVRLAVGPDEMIPGVGPRIAGPDESGELEPESRTALMLLYVAVTRAQDRLWVPADVDRALDRYITENIREAAEPTALAG